MRNSPGAPHSSERCKITKILAINQKNTDFSFRNMHKYRVLSTTNGIN